MNAAKRVTFFFLGILILTGCSPSTKVDERLEVTLQSEQQVYSADEKISLRLENTTDNVVYLNYCGPVLLYQLEVKGKEKWKTVGSGICLAIYASEFVPAVKPGKSKVIELYQQKTGQYRYSLSYTLSSASSKVQQVNEKFGVR
ncbi:MAG: hypothetical protein U5K69_13365 [Balneolaceae bacterium]|nr:hypothetical protein [Balneolaceae bacterium]